MTTASPVVRACVFLFVFLFCCVHACACNVCDIDGFFF